MDWGTVLENQLWNPLKSVLSRNLEVDVVTHCPLGVKRCASYTFFLLLRLIMAF